MTSKRAADSIFDHLRLAEVAAPSTPATGSAILYVKSDARVYYKDDAGTEHQVAHVSEITGSAALQDLTDVSPTATDDAVTGDVLTFDGSVWAPAATSGGGGGAAMEVPNLGSSTGWTNVGSSPTIDFGSTVADMCYIEKTPANGTTDAYFGAYRSWTPSAGQKRRVMVRSHKLNSTLQAVGMFVADSSSGKALLWEAYGNNAGGGTSRLHWRAMSGLTSSVNDADTTVVAGFESTSPTDGFWGPFYLEIEYTSATSYQLRHSLDGFLFRTIVTNKNPDSAFTPNSWGIHVYTYGSTTPPQGLFQRYEEL